LEENMHSAELKLGEDEWKQIEAAARA
jgi:hypothetical protein